MEKRLFIYFSAALAIVLSASFAFAQSIQTTVIITVAPNAPSDLVAIPLAPTQVELTWTNNASGADGVSIERKMGVLGTYLEIATTTPDLATYVDNSVSPAMTYFYQVAAFQGSIYSPESNDTSVTTPDVPIPPAPSSGGGGGGGGGGSYSPSLPPAGTSVVISGAAYPGSEVTILQNGQIVVETDADPNGMFNATIGNLAGGNYIFSLYAEDSAGNRSSLYTFPASVTTGATTEISGIFISPTISVDKSVVKQGDTLTIFGESLPNAAVSIQVNSDQTIFGSATSDAAGAYVYDLDTSPLALGSHSAKSKAASNNLISNESVVKTFTVGTENVAAPSPSACPLKGDLNGDCKVNLIDFSILAYWFGKSGFPPAYDLNGDGQIDLADFSIMAYYWTG